MGNLSIRCWAGATPGQKLPPPRRSSASMSFSWLFLGGMLSSRARRRFTNQGAVCRTLGLPVENFAANGELSLNYLSHPKGQAQLWISGWTARSLWDHSPTQKRENTTNPLCGSAVAGFFIAALTSPFARAMLIFTAAFTAVYTPPPQEARTDPNAMSARCEIVELRFPTDTVGYVCTQPAIQHCDDCGTSLCIAHSEMCDKCHQIFCSGCLSFHVEQLHSKPATGVRVRKSEERSA